MWRHKNCFQILPEALPTKIYLTACQALHHRVANQNVLSQFDLLHASLNAGKISLRDTVIYLIANTCIFFVALQLSYEKNSTQQKANISQGSSANRYPVSSAYQYKSHYAPVGPMGAGQSNSSRSEPNLVLHQRTVPSRSGPSKRIQTMKTGASRSQRATSQFITRTTVPPPQYAANGQTKANNQFIYSRIDTVKAPKLNVTEPSFKSKMDSGWVGKYSLSFPEFHI